MAANLPQLGGFLRAENGCTFVFAGDASPNEARSGRRVPGLISVPQPCVRRIALLLVLGTLGFVLRSVAQAPLPTAFLDQLSVENGLSQSEVSCVRKDRRGYVWIGTQNGLNRYDGYRVVQYRHDPFDPQTLSNDHILTIHEDAAGRLWIGTTQGLNLYHPGTNRFRRYGSELDSLRKGKSLPVYALAHDAAGTLWVGTSRGVRHFWVGNEPDFPRLRPADAHRFLFDGQPTWLLYRDRQDRLWAGTRQGLFRQSASTPGRPAVFEYLTAQTVNAIAEDAANRLWLATDEGLYRFEPGPNRLLPVPVAGLREGIAALLVDQRGLLWISTPERGVCRFRVGATGTLQPLDCIRESYFSRNGLKSGTVTCFYESTRPHEDVVWLGTKDAGAHAYSHSKNQFRHWEDMPATERAMGAHLIFSLCTDRRGQLWVGTYQGLFRIDRRTGQTRHFRPDPTRRHRLGSDKIQALYEDRRGQLWVGTDAGLFRYRPGIETFEPVRLTPDGDAEPYVLRLYEDRAGTLWIGAGYGLYRLDSGGYRQVFGYDPKQAGARPAYLVSAIQEDAEGYLWLGTATGLYKMHPKTGHLTHFINNPGNPASLIGTEIYGLLLDARKRLWVCSNKGLSQLVSTPGGEQFVHVGVRDGLPNDVVYGALADRRGRLWLSTNFGLSCFDPQHRTFRNYAAADGLGRNEFNMGAFHQSPDGEFFFGGIGTLVSFDPLRMTPSQYAPPVVLTSFKTFEKTVNADSLLLRHGRLTLGPEDNFFSFVFSALDYTNPERNQYAYRLEGFDDDWIYSGTRRYASFTNLPPGDYVLKVKASNADGVWNEAGILEVPLTIKPPVWRQWWFITAVLLALGGAARRGCFTTTACGSGWRICSNWRRSSWPKTSGSGSWPPRICTTNSATPSPGFRC
jgi:ligand-binding sensor domain-containing protein